jgi:hypothetical protein
MLSGFRVKLVADGGGGGLQIWRVATSILNKQTRKADEGPFSGLVVEREANIFLAAKSQHFSKWYSGSRSWTRSECYSFRLLFSNVNIKIYKIIVLYVVLYGFETWSLILREGHKVGMIENRVMRVFGSKRDEAIGG